MQLHEIERELHALMLLGLEGDPDAYKALLKRLSGYLRAFLMRRLQGWPDDVEDLVQECLLAVHNKRHTYQPDQPLTAWVYAIARYKMIDLLRSKSAREALHEPLDDEAEFLADSTAQTGEAMRDLNILLQTLPDRHRLPIQHVKLEGYSVAEAARQTGMSESAIKVGVHRGLKALAQRIRSTRT